MLSDPPLLPLQYFHVTPFSRLPEILRANALLCFSEQRRRSIAGPTARPFRARRPVFHDVIHLGLSVPAPLLTARRARHGPHVLLTFSPTIVRLPDVFFLRYNPRAWRHRDDFALIPVSQSTDFLREWHAGKYPSAELLVSNRLPLTPFLQAVRLV